MDYTTKRKTSAPGHRRVLSDCLKTAGILILLILMSELFGFIGVDKYTLAMLYLLAVLVIARVTTSYVYGIVAAIINTVVFEFIVVPPRFAFMQGSPVTLLTMLVGTFLMSTLTTRMRTQATLAMEREHRTQLLYEINQKLLAARSTESIAEIADSYLSEHLKCPAILYTCEPTLSHDAPEEQDGSPDGFGSEREIKIVRDLFKSDVSDVAVLYEGERKINYIPVVSKNKVIGVIGTDCRKRPLSDGEYSFLQMFTGQLSLAMGLQKLSDERVKITMDAEREKVRNTLLRSVSHDLRTPLTSISGAASTILEQDNLDMATVKSLTADIRENVQWLIRMIENILLITKITGEGIQIKKDTEAAEEVLAQAVSNVRKRFPEYHFRISAPDEILMAPMDATLISQVLINLIENAAKNSAKGSTIMLDLKRSGDYVEFIVDDNGRGISKNLLDNLFEVHSPHAQSVVDGSRGMGIGLSICKTIVTAHGGMIEGGNRESGGARFSFRLPFEEGQGHE